MRGRVHGAFCQAGVGRDAEAVAADLGAVKRALERP